MTAATSIAVWTGGKPRILIGFCPGFRTSWSSVTGTLEDEVLSDMGWSGDYSGEIGQNGAGLPTLEYPRYILERCTSVSEAIAFCQQTPMAGKGLSIAVVDADGEGVIIEKSGTATAVRYPSFGTTK